jgi:signal transduction histidine kinase
MQPVRSSTMKSENVHGRFGFRKYRLTMVFLVVSALIFAGVAAAINITTTASEEEQVVSITTAESIKDARTIAGIVTELLESESGASPMASTQVPGAVSSVDITQFLTNSEIVGLNIYLPDGALAWSSSVSPVALPSAQREIFTNALTGSIATGLVKGSTVLGSMGQSIVADTVETYVPFTDSESGEVALVLGVTRDVTSILSTSISQSRSAVFQSTLLSLGIGFLVLLATVFIADVRMWKQRELAIAYERESASSELSFAKLNLANHELQQVTEEREKILSTVSHELKTPLTSIVAFTDILSRNQSGEEKERNQKHLQIVRRSSDHLLALINDLLTFNRMSPVDTGVAEDEFELIGLLDEVRETMEPLLSAKRQTLVINGGEKIPAMRMDRRRVLQALLNLLSNSSKFSNEGSVVLMEFRLKDDVLQILVADPGIGMSEERQAELLENRVTVGTGDDAGHGLGFGITKDIVEAHGGHISIDSQLGRGARISIDLPMMID